MHLIIFKIDNQQLAFELSDIERVLMAVEISPLPHTTDHLMGVIDVHGEIVPVINLRKILNIADRDLLATDQIIIGSVNNCRIAMCVDSVNKVAEFQADEIQSSKGVPDRDGMVAFIKNDKDLVFIYKLESLLSADVLSQIAKVS